MLAHARQRLAQADFRLGELQQLPVETAGVDVVVCSLALSHVPDLAPVFDEFARVLRPGGHLVIADMHPEQVARSRVPTIRRADGAAGRVRSYHHRIGDYVRAGVAAGLTIRRCDEPVNPATVHDPNRRPRPVGGLALVARLTRPGASPRRECRCSVDDPVALPTIGPLSPDYR